MSNLMQINVGLLTPHFKFTQTGMEVLTKQPSYQEWFKAGVSFKDMHSLVELGQIWGWADWLNEGEKRYGETYTQAMDIIGREYQTLANWKWVGSRIPKGLRGLPNLRFRHYTVAAKLKGDMQADLLKRASAGKWTKEALGIEIATILAPEDTPPPSFPDEESPIVEPVVIPPAMPGDRVFELVQENYALQQQVIIRETQIQEITHTVTTVREMLQAESPTPGLILGAITQLEALPQTGASAWNLFESLLDLWEKGKTGDVYLMLDKLVELRRKSSAAPEKEDFITLHAGDRTIELER